MEKNVKNRTMSVVREELNASVDKYNLATDAAVRNQLALEHIFQFCSMPFPTL